MDSEKQLIPKWQAPGVANEIYDHAAAAKLAGISTRVFIKYWKMDLYQPLGDVNRFGIFFDIEAVYLARQAEQMRLKLNVDMRAAALIVKLRKEVETLRTELDFWRK